MIKRLLLVAAMLGSLATTKAQAAPLTPFKVDILLPDGQKKIAGFDITELEIRIDDAITAHIAAVRDGKIRRKRLLGKLFGPKYKVVADWRVDAAADVSIDEGPTLECNDAPCNPFAWPQHWGKGVKLSASIPVTLMLDAEAGIKPNVWPAGWTSTDLHLFNTVVIKVSIPYGPGLTRIGDAQLDFLPQEDGNVDIDGLERVA